MAKITIEELFYGDKYAVISEVLKTMFRTSPNKAGVDEQTALELEIARQTLIAVEKMKKTVTVLPRENSGMRSPFLYAEVLMKTIDELWYGNISPFEQCTRGDKRLKDLPKLYRSPLKLQLQYRSHRMKLQGDSIRHQADLKTY